MADAPEVLYLSYNGIDEPLVRSQVLAYLERLAEQGWRFHLLTFEREARTPQQEAATREALAARGIAWQGLRAQRGLGPLSTAWDVWRGIRAARRLCRAHAIVLLHARSFVPAVIAWRVKLATRLPYLNDLRGFWVDEKVYRGRLRQHGLAYALGKFLEARVLRASDALVSLTGRGAEALAAFGAWRGAALPPLAVIPTCVDTARFAPQARAPRAAPVFGYVGSLGPEYLPEEVFAFFAAALRRHPQARLHLVTRTPPEALQPYAVRHALGPAQWQVQRLAPAEVPAAVAQFDVALSFIRPHFAKLASCPTKVGEYLAAGVPVVANAGIGDMDALLADGDIGVLLSPFTPAARAEALVRVERLLTQPDLAARCRGAALAHFDLEEGVRRYAQIYRKLGDGGSPAC